MGDLIGLPDPAGESASQLSGRRLLKQLCESDQLPGLWQINGWGVIGRYVFLYNQDAALAVQVDDELNADQVQGDEELKQHGVTTLRFTSDQVVAAKLDHIVEQVTAAVATGLATRTAKEQVASLAAAAMDARFRPLSAVEASAEQPCAQLSGIIAGVSRQLAERTGSDATQWADRITGALGYLGAEDRCRKAVTLVPVWWNDSLGSV